MPTSLKRLYEETENSVSQTLETRPNPTLDYGSLKPFTIAKSGLRDSFVLDLYDFHKKLNTWHTDAEKGQVPTLQTGILPRDYQIKKLTEYFNGLAEGKIHGVITLPTGTGKTLVFSILISALLNSKICVITPSRKLLTQIKKELKKLSPNIDISLYDSQKPKNFRAESSIIIATYQAIVIDQKNRAKKNTTQHTENNPSEQISSTTALDSETTLDQKFKFNEFDLLILDEAHHADSPAWEIFLKTVKTENPSLSILGFSATPGQKIYNILGPNLINFSDFTIKAAIERDILAPMIVAHLYFNDEDKKLEKAFKKYAPLPEETQQDISEKKLSKILNQEEYNNAIVDVYANRINEISGAPFLGQFTLVFCTDIKHAVAVADAFNTHIRLDDHPIITEMRERYVKTMQEEHKRKYEIYCRKSEALNSASFDNRTLTAKRNQLEKKYGSYIKPFNRKEIDAEFKIAETIHSKLNKQKRSAIIKAFKNGQFLVLTNARELIEGYDNPKITLNIHFSPTGSNFVAIQRAGRPSRKLNNLNSDEEQKVVTLVEMIYPTEQKIFDEIIGGRQCGKIKPRTTTLSEQSTKKIDVPNAANYKIDYENNPSNTITPPKKRSRQSISSTQTSSLLKKFEKALSVISGLEKILKEIEEKIKAILNHLANEGLPEIRKTDDFQPEKDFYPMKNPVCDKSGKEEEIVPISLDDTAAEHDQKIEEHARKLQPRVDKINQQLHGVLKLLFPDEESLFENNDVGFSSDSDENTTSSFSHDKKSNPNSIKSAFLNLRRLKSNFSTLLTQLRENKNPQINHNNGIQSSADIVMTDDVIEKKLDEVLLDIHGIKTYFEEHNVLQLIEQRKMVNQPSVSHVDAPLAEEQIPNPLSPKSYETDDLAPSVPIEANNNTAIVSDANETNSTIDLETLLLSEDISNVKEDAQYEIFFEDLIGDLPNNAPETTDASTSNTYILEAFFTQHGSELRKTFQSVSKFLNAPPTENKIRE